MAEYIHRVHVVSENPQLIVLSPRANNLISFDDDLKSLDYSHVDALLLTLQISNCEVAVFIDPNAGVNIIFKGTLRNMDNLESEFLPWNAALVDTTIVDRLLWI